MARGFSYEREEKRMEKKISGLNFLYVSTYLGIIDKLPERNYIVENGVIYEVVESEVNNNDNN